MAALPFILAAIGGYLMGSIPFGLVLTRAAGLGDIRNVGSGNIGATNVLRTGRKDIALATLLLDAGKAAAALLIASALAGNESRYQIELGLIAGTAAFIGHCYPVWLGFKGGKGVATYFGLILVGMPPLGVVIGLTWVAVATMFRFSSLAGLVASALAPVLAIIGGYATSQVVCLMVLAALIFWRHRANIARLRTGTEPRIGAGKSETAPVAEPQAAPQPTSEAAPQPAPQPAPQTAPQPSPQGAPQAAPQPAPPPAPAPASEPPPSPPQPPAPTEG